MMTVRFYCRKYLFLIIFRSVDAYMHLSVQRFWWEKIKKYMLTSVVYFENARRPNKHQICWFVLHWHMCTTRICHKVATVNEPKRVRGREKSACIKNSLSWTRVEKRTTNSTATMQTDRISPIFRNHLTIFTMAHTHTHMRICVHIFVIYWLFNGNQQFLYLAISVFCRSALLLLLFAQHDFPWNT